MGICMAGIDWRSAGMDRREAFSFTGNRVSRLCAQLIQREGIYGCVLLSTCNRTELYLSGADSLQSAQLLCELAGEPDARQFLYVRRGTHASKHLMRVACGLRSQILGDDQIVSQVRKAYQLAHETGSTDAVLSQLFRLAVTAGKRSRSCVRLSAAPLSAAGQAVACIEQHMPLRGRRALVIGNGEMGRLTSKLLVERGCEVTVTLRSYHRGHTIVPAGCKAVSYDERMACIGACDILVSATTSPHYTVTYDGMRQLSHTPGVICDLAVPRDIEPTIKELDGVQLFLDMDSFGGRDVYVDPEDRKLVEDIIQEEMAEFDRWQTYRDALPMIEELERLSAERIAAGYDLAVLTDGEDAETRDKMECAARLAAEKTARLLLSGMQGALSEETLEICRDALLRKAPQLKNGGCGDE